MERFCPSQRSSAGKTGALIKYSVNCNTVPFYTRQRGELKKTHFVGYFSAALFLKNIIYFFSGFMASWCVFMPGASRTRQLCAIAVREMAGHPTPIDFTKC